MTAITVDRVNPPNVHEAIIGRHYRSIILGEAHVNASISGNHRHSYRGNAAHPLDMLAQPLNLP
jgi:hypothetical protein